MPFPKMKGAVVERDGDESQSPEMVYRAIERAFKMLVKRVVYLVEQTVIVDLESCDLNLISSFI